MENTFGINVISQNEEQRVQNLEKYKILRTKSEPIFDQLAAVAATLFNVPMAMINFVDTEGVLAETDEGTSLCSLAILNEQVTVFEDVIKEPCLVSNPLIAGCLGLKFYAAAPITTSAGFNIGAVCIVDKMTRKFSSQEQQQLEWIANMVTAELNKRDISIC